ncbi:MAG TPA: acyl-ACP--UDP-N-acetylglucosamine O-acyltransferase [Limnochordales bacterium]
MRTSLHPAAVVEPGARVGPDVVVGPFAFIGAGAEIGAGCVIEAFAVIHGGTRLGPHNHVGIGAVLGGQPQDVRYAGEPTQLVLGEGNRIGSHAVLHRGTPGGGGVTSVGDGCIIEDGAHIGHDCRVGDRVRLGAGSALGGHSVIGDGAVIGAMTGVHQFTHVGRLAYIESHATVTRDVPPFARAGGSPAEILGFHREGLESWGASPEAIEAVSQAFEWIYASGLRLQEALERIAGQIGRFDEVQELLRFMEERRRGLMR